MMATKIPYVLEIERLRAEMRAVSDELYELYNETCDSTPPEIYASIFGLHERLDVFLDGGYGPPEKPADLRVQEKPKP
jgi:hypothetical protein